MIIRTKYFLSIVLAALIAFSVQSQKALAVQDVPHERAGAGAAQPEPQERYDDATKKEKATSHAEEIRNAPSVRKLAQWTGLSNEKAYWLSIFLNFAILAFLLGLLLKKVLPTTFKNRKSIDPEANGRSSQNQRGSPRALEAGGIPSVAAGR